MTNSTKAKATKAPRTRLERTRAAIQKRPFTVAGGTSLLGLVIGKLTSGDLTKVIERGFNLADRLMQIFAGVAEEHGPFVVYTLGSTLIVLTVAVGMVVWFIKTLKEEIERHVAEKKYLQKLLGAKLESSKETKFGGPGQEPPAPKGRKK